MPVLNDGLTLAQLTDNARAGLRTPRVVTLGAGEILFRFASTSQPNHVWAAGPWWMYEHDYRKVIEVHTDSQHKHGEDGMTLGFLGRQAMAVQQSWSRMDVVVKAVVMQDIQAFCGRGATQYREMMPNGIYVTWGGWSDVEQLFVPNIGDRKGRTPLGNQALRVLRQKVVSSQQLY